MPLSAGDKLGPYEILARLGAGGMGEVYRARDQRLNRDVALKVLSAALAQDADYTARFQREAQVLAALCHPNIAQIYGIEQNAIVMELVEGDEPRGPLSVVEALQIARQIAEALEAAHEKGIVHRDLKPANLKITPGGAVKVLDFGLAKADEVSSGAAKADSPTLTMRATQAGMIMGTASYMAPEQAAGRPVDCRADIWSFGVVLWELLTGKRLFNGETISHTLASVLKDPIPLDLPRVPPAIRELLARCLERNPKERLRDVGEARIAICKYLANPVPQKPAEPPRRGSSIWIALACATATMAAIAAAGWFHASRPVEKPLIHFEVDLGTDLTPIGRAAISPDGSRIAFVAGDKGGKVFLLSRKLDQPKATVLDQSNRGAPFFSPDGKWIGYEADDKLKKIPAEGGLPVTITSGITTAGIGRDRWGESGDIVSWFTFGGLARVSASGGGAEPIAGAEGFSSASFLPGGTELLLSGPRGPGLSVLPLRGGKATPIAPAQGDKAQYVPAGYILYIDIQSVLQALPFDAGRMTVKGAAIPILEDVIDFDVSSGGTLLCERGSDRDAFVTVQWVDESGKTEPIISTPASYGSPRLSPDGKRLALTISNDKGSSLWIRNLQTSAMSRVTPGDSASFPVWMPSGKNLVFRGADGIYVVPADGGEKPRRITESAKPSSVSPDGRTLAVYRSGRETARDIWLVPLEGEAGNLQAGKPEPLLNGPADEIQPVFSPDGKWLAYASTESGTFQIYVRSVKNPGATWQFATGYAAWPQWSSHGKEIFFRTVDNHAAWVASYSVNGDTFVPGAVRPFGGDVQAMAMGDTWVFSIAPQGNRLVELVAAKDPEGTRQRPDYAVLLNFFDEIRRRSAQTGAK